MEVLRQKREEKKQWELKKVILKEGKLLERDIIVTTQDQNGKLDIGHVKLGNYETPRCVIGTNRK
jgi:hypothetical protein